MSEDHAVKADVAVVGLGYIGLVLAVGFARAGLRVVGVERHAHVRESIRQRRPQFYEPGLTDALESLPADLLRVRETMAGVDAGAVVICVGTGYDRANDAEDLTDVRRAIDMAMPAIKDDTLVVVRSTVPVGTCRTVVLPRLAEVVSSPLLAFCPERTIQGRALTEISSLPQVIGALDDVSGKRAAELFCPLNQILVQISTLEAAELVKLICNSHTDILYGFGNEVAFIASALGLDALEVIEAANRGYPRPDIARPGFVGGSCLIKDPHLLALTSRKVGFTPHIILGARAVNEQVPRWVVSRVIEGLASRGIRLADAKVLVCGITYKGHPETDDIRGAASIDVRDALADRVSVLAGHDPMLPERAIVEAGFVPTALEEGIAGAHAIVVLTNHAAYRGIDLAAVKANAHPDPLIVDVWGVLDEAWQKHGDLDYVRFGRG